MKRFWKETTVQPVGQAWEVLLDGRSVKTPKRAPLHLPTEAMAKAIAAEWDAVEENIKPEAMPLTGFANAAIDIVSTQKDSFADSLSEYAESDLTCYRADHPNSLVKRQSDVWEPALRAIEMRHSILFERTTGIIHVAQPPETLEAVRNWFRNLSAWELAPMQPIVTITGSAVLAMAMAEGILNEQETFDAGALDELHQVEYWGEDEEAKQARERKRAEFAASTTFLAISRNTASIG